MWVSGLRSARKESARCRWELNVGASGAMILTTSHCPLHVLCRGPVQTFFMYLKPRAASLGLLHRLYDTGAARLAVLGA